MTAHENDKRGWVRFRRKLGVHLDEEYFDGGRFVPVRLVEAIQDELHIVSLSTEDFIRVYQNGLYAPDKGVLHAMMREILGDSFSVRKANEVVEILRRDNLIFVENESVYPFTHPDQVNVANGILEVRTEAFRPHSPGFHSLIQLPHQYDPTATCPKIDAWLEETFGNLPGMVQFAIDILAIGMLMRGDFGFIYILEGPSNTGKGTFLKFGKAFLGGHTSAKSLQKIDNEDNRFERAGLVGNAFPNFRKVPLPVFDGPSRI